MNNLLEIINLNLRAGDLKIEVPYIKFEQEKSTCIVGQSGSGKSLFAAAISGINLPGITFTGEVLLNGVSSKEPLWKEQVFVLPQEPAVALDPTMPVKDQLAEIFRWRSDPGCEFLDVLQVCETVGLLHTDVEKYPGQLSGGMQQRVMIAMALIAGTTFIIADEPTKGLDAHNRSVVIELFKKIQASGKGLVIITHDLYVARELAEEVVVFERGAIIEKENSAKFFTSPQSDAARLLIQNEPLNWAQELPTLSEDSSSVMSLENVSFGFGDRSTLIQSVSLTLAKGEILGLCGSSGIGKSTLADICLGIQKPQSGTVKWFGEVASDAFIKQHRSSFQKLFQNPISSFPPKIKLDDVFKFLSPQLEMPGFSVDDLFTKLSLDRRLLKRRADQVSGGELQRLAIVRVLLAQPKLLVCDEPSSRLDMSIQKMAIDIITDYANESSAAVLLISHDETILKKRAHKILKLT